MIDIIVPIFNEGKQVVKLIELFSQKIHSEFSVYLCYDDEDDDVFEFKDELSNFVFPIHFVKNDGKGPCKAVITGLKKSDSDCKIVYPADDFLNVEILDQMYSEYSKNNADLVVASRFIKGGSMKGCPLLKSILVRTASFTLFKLSSIPVRDASNGFRLFSGRLLKKVQIESKLGFAYSLELLVKCNRLKMKIEEIPAKWEERSIGESNFKIFKWIKEYLKWYIYGLETFWLKKRKPININEKNNSG